MGFTLDASSFNQGFAGMTNAIGNLQDIRLKNQFGEQAAQAETDTKVANSQLAQLNVQAKQQELDKAVLAEQQNKMTIAMQAAEYQNKIARDAVRNAVKTGQPLSQEGLAASLEIASNSPIWQQAVISGDFTNVGKLNSIVIDASNNLTKIFQDNKVDKFEEKPYIKSWVDVHNLMLPDSQKLSVDNVQFRNGQIFTKDASDNWNLADENPMNTLMMLHSYSNMFDKTLETMRTQKFSEFTQAYRDTTLQKAAARDLISNLPSNIRQQALDRLDVTLPSELPNVLTELKKQADTHMSNTQTKVFTDIYDSLQFYYKGKTVTGKELRQSMIDDKTPPDHINAVLNIAINKMISDPKISYLMQGQDRSEDQLRKSLLAHITGQTVDLGNYQKLLAELKKPALENELKKAEIVQKLADARKKESGGSAGEESQSAKWLKIAKDADAMLNSGINLPEKTRNELTAIRDNALGRIGGSDKGNQPAPDPSALGKNKDKGFWGKALDLLHITKTDNTSDTDSGGSKTLAALPQGTSKKRTETANKINQAFSANAIPNKQPKQDIKAVTKTQKKADEEKKNYGFGSANTRMQ